MPTTCTPLRYPGGKSSLSPLLSSLICEANLIGCTYAEPFAGGGGLALKLLFNGDVSHIVLNDLDPAVAAIWLYMVNGEGRLQEFIRTIPLTIDEWNSQHETYHNLRTMALAAYCGNKPHDGRSCASPLDYLHDTEKEALACAAFYMNRTNRSGIMNGGPIGGKEQKGAYRIDARFNRDTLVEKANRIASMSEHITVTNLDAFDFIERLDNHCGTDLPTCDVLLCLDPPYVKKGPGLYQNSFTAKDHEQLAEMICKRRENWIVTYDDCPLVQQLYGHMHNTMITVSYSAYHAKKGSEMLIVSDSLARALKSSELFGDYAA